MRATQNNMQGNWKDVNTIHGFYFDGWKGGGGDGRTGRILSQNHRRLYNRPYNYYNSEGKHLHVTRLHLAYDAGNLQCERESERGGGMLETSCLQCASGTNRCLIISPEPRDGPQYIGNT